MTMRLSLATILVVAVLGPAGAVTVRPIVTLQGADVRLSDLFDGAASDRRLGPAPPPGERFTVEAPQLAAIARQFGVDWRPATGGERTVVERAGKPLAREAAEAAIRAALAGAGAPQNLDIDLAAFAAPMLPAEGEPVVSVASLDYDRASGRFAAALSIVSTDRSATGMRLVGQAWETIALPVLTRRLSAGAVPATADVSVIRVRSATVRDEIATSPADIVGRALKRPLVAGVPVSLADLGAPLLVHKGALVAMTLDSPGIAVTARGLALDSGGRGERVRVQNPNSRAVMEAEVVGDDRVRVSPDTTPTVPPEGVAANARKVALR